MKKPLSPAEALHKAAAYCTLCERCTAEVAAKLTTWGIATGQQPPIIERLISEGFINHTRYCNAFASDKVRFNRWGKIKIAAALRDKQLPRELIAQAIDTIDEEQYLASLNAVIATKRKELKNDDSHATQQKIIRHAASRGYEPALIIKAIKYQGDEMDILPHRPHFPPPLPGMR